MVNGLVIVNYWRWTVEDLNEKFNVGTSTAVEDAERQLKVWNRGLKDYQEPEEVWRRRWYRDIMQQWNQGVQEKQISRAGTTGMGSASKFKRHEDSGNWKTTRSQITSCIGRLPSMMMRS
jgi:hypothetical protein